VRGKFSKIEKLVEAAIDEFSAHTYYEASLNRILKRAGVSKGEFYYHFRSKEELYLYILDLIVEKKKENLSEVLKKRPNGFFELLEMGIKANIEMFRKYPKLSRMSFQLLKVRDKPIYRKVLTQFEDVSIEFLEKYVRQGVEEGEIRDDIPLEFLIKFLNMVFFHLNELYEDEIDIDRMEEYLSYLIKILKYGLIKQ